MVTETEQLLEKDTSEMESAPGRSSEDETVPAGSSEDSTDFDIGDFINDENDVF